MAKIIEASAVISARAGDMSGIDKIAAKLAQVSKAGDQVKTALSGAGTDLARRVQEISQRLASIDNFRSMSRGLDSASIAMRQAQQNAERLRQSLDSAAKPTRAMQAEYERASRAVDRATSAFRQQGQAVREARAALEASGIPVNQIARQQAQLTASLNKTTEAMQKQAAAGKALATGRAPGSPAPAPQQSAQRGAMPLVGSGVGIGAGVGGAFTARSAYERAIEFERSVNASQARGELSPEEADRMRRNARELGARGLGFTATQVSELQRAYVQAGYEKSADALALPTMQFSRFGDVDPFKAADFTVSALSAYRVKPRTSEEAVAAATRYQDIIAKGANISRLSVDDFAQGFKYSAPLASMLGITKEQLAAMIATQGQAGLRGDEAGVAVRSMLTRLVRPTADSRQVLAEMGLTFEQFNRETRPIDPGAIVRGLRNQGVDISKIEGQLPGIIERARASGDDPATAVSQGIIQSQGITSVIDQRKISKMVARHVSSLGESIDIDALINTLRDRGATAGQISRIFDAKQGTRLSTILADDVYQQFERVLREESTGASARGAAVMNQGAVGAHNRLVSSYDNLILSLAESGVLDTVSKGLDAVASGLRSLAETSPRLLEFGTYAVMAAGALGPLAFAVKGLAAAAGVVTGGGAVAGAVGAAGAAAAGASKLPLFARLGLYGAGGYVGYQAGSALSAIGSVATGQHYTPATPDAVGDLKARLAEIEAKIASAEGRIHPSMRGNFNPDLDRMRGQAQELRNRLELAPGGQLEAVVKPDQITAKSEVTGQATVRVEIAPTGALTGLIQGAANAATMPLSGGSGPGSTGRSMPEAAAAPVGVQGPNQ